MNKPKVGDIIYQPPILTGGKKNFWLVESVCKPKDIEEPWPEEFKAFFNDVGLPGLYNTPMYDTVLGTMKNIKTGEVDVLTELFWKLFAKR